MSLLSNAGVILRELTRHILRRPVVGVAAIPRTADGRVLLIRRGDTGNWALPGGTLEWNETLLSCLPRELEEETGATMVRVERVTGVYSRPDRDWRFHGVTVAVLVEVVEPIRGPHNKLEIREARLFARQDIPEKLDFGGAEILAHALDGEGVVLELPDASTRIPVGRAPWGSGGAGFLATLLRRSGRQQCLRARGRHGETQPRFQLKEVGARGNGGSLLVAHRKPTRLENRKHRAARLLELSLELSLRARVGPLRSASTERGQRRTLPARRRAPPRRRAP